MDSNVKKHDEHGVHVDVLVLIWRADFSVKFATPYKDQTIT